MLFQIGRNSILFIARGALLSAALGFYLPAAAVAEDQPYDPQKACPAANAALPSIQNASSLCQKHVGLMNQTTKEISKIHNESVAGAVAAQKTIAERKASGQSDAVASTLYLNRKSKSDLSRAWATIDLAKQDLEKSQKNNIEAPLEKIRTEQKRFPVDSPNFTEVNHTFKQALDKQTGVLRSSNALQAQLNEINSSYTKVLNANASEKSALIASMKGFESVPSGESAPKPAQAPGGHDNSGASQRPTDEAPKPQAQSAPPAANPEPSPRTPASSAPFESTYPEPEKIKPEVKAPPEEPTTPEPKTDSKPPADDKPPATKEPPTTDFHPPGEAPPPPSPREEIPPPDVRADQPPSDADAGGPTFFGIPLFGSGKTSGAEGGVAGVSAAAAGDSAKGEKGKLGSESAGKKGDGRQSDVTIAGDPGLQKWSLNKNSNSGSNGANSNGGDPFASQPLTNHPIAAAILESEENTGTETPVQSMKMNELKKIKNELAARNEKPIPGEQFDSPYAASGTTAEISLPAANGKAASLLKKLRGEKPKLEKEQPASFAAGSEKPAPSLPANPGRIPASENTKTAKLEDPAQATKIELSEEEAKENILRFNNSGEAQATEILDENSPALFTRISEVHRRFLLGHRLRSKAL